VRSAASWALAASLAVACAPRPAVRPDPGPKAPSPDGLYRRASADWDAGRPERALLGLQRLLAWYPDHLTAQQALVGMLGAQHGVEAIVEFLRDRAQVHAGSLGPTFALAHALAQVGDEAGLREAHGLLAKAGGEEAPPEVLRTLADLAAALDDLDGATAILERLAIQRGRAGDDSAQIEALLQAGRYHHIAGRFERALSTTRAAANRAREHGKAAAEVRSLHALGALYQSLGRLGDALATFDASVARAAQAKLVPAHATALVNRAEVLASRLDETGARKSLDQAVELALGAGDPALEGKVRTRLARFELRLGRPEPAMEQLNQATRALGESDAWDALAEALELAGDILQAAGDLAETAAARAEAVRIRSAIAEADGPAVPLARALLALGRTLVDGGDIESARTAFEEAATVAKGGGSPVLEHAALEGVVLTDLRAANVEDLGMSMDRLAKRGEPDPWLAAEFHAATGRIEPAVAAAERAIGTCCHLPAGDLAVRFGLLLGLYVTRSAEGDAERAWATALAGATATSAGRLADHGVRIRHGIDPELLAEANALEAATTAADLMLEEPLTASSRKAWASRRDDLATRRTRWRTRVAEHHPAWAGLNLPRVVFEQAGRLAVPKKTARIILVDGEGALMTLVATAAGIRVLPLPLEAPLWDTLAPLLKGVREVVLSPPPGRADVDWGALPAGGKPAGERYRLSLRPALADAALPDAAGGKAAHAGAELTLTDPDAAALVGQDLLGAKLDLRMTQHPARGARVDLLVRVALFAGAAEVRVTLGEGGVLRYR